MYNLVYDFKPGLFTDTDSIMPISIDDEVFWEYAKTQLVERLEEAKGSVDG
jgi:hypothetical protein